MENQSQNTISAEEAEIKQRKAQENYDRYRAKLDTLRSVISNAAHSEINSQQALFIADAINTAFDKITP